MRLLGLTRIGFIMRARECKSRGFLFLQTSWEIIRKRIAKETVLVVKIHEPIPSGGGKFKTF